MSARLSRNRANSKVEMNDDDNTDNKCNNKKAAKLKTTASGPIRLPGVSRYIEPGLDQENQLLMEKLCHEFVEFLDCVADLLHLVTVLKAKHLRSMKPLPNDVIREIRSYGAAGGGGLKLAEFERNIRFLSAGIHSSVENILKGVNTSASPWKRREMPKNTKANSSKTQSEGILSELREIVGKQPPMPKWHRVVLKSENMAPAIEGVAQASTTRLLDSQSHHSNFSAKSTVASGTSSSVHSDSGLEEPTTSGWHHPATEEDKRHALPVFKSRSQTWLETIQRSRQCNIKPANKWYSDQMDMIEAYKAGFSSVEEHKNYVSSLTPHWFTALLKTAHASGVMDVGGGGARASFERLSRFYYFDPDPHHFPQAKLCFLLLSLPLWDVTRVAVQRAAAFVLEEVFEVEEEPKTVIGSWLVSRKLPYLVIPPIYQPLAHDKNAAR